jgi:hypothetical protein
MLFALVDPDHQHDSRRSRDRGQPVTSRTRNRDALTHQQRVPVRILPDRQRIDPHRRPGHERLGKDNQLGSLSDRFAGQLLDSVERRLAVEQDRAVLDSRDPYGGARQRAHVRGNLPTG